MASQEQYSREYVQETWGVPSAAKVCSGSCGSSQSTKGSKKVGNRPVARLWDVKELPQKISFTRKPPTCQQSVINNSQNSARRFCVSEGARFHLAQSRSARCDSAMPL